MIDPAAPLEVQISKQAKIIEALIRRADRRHEVGDTAYSLFQSAISLQAAVWKKTKDLEIALDTLGQASRELEAARLTQENLQKNLADAMIAIEGGFALFAEDRLQICNGLFQQLLPDVEPLIHPGLLFADYLAAVRSSRFLSDQAEADGVGRALPGSPPQVRGSGFSSFVLALRNDRWFQITHHQTSSNNMVVLQTEITDIVLENRREKKQLIDRHAHFLQAAFDHMSLGICTFSSRRELLVCNDRFGELLGVPPWLLKKGTSIDRITEYIKRFGIMDRRRNVLKFEDWFQAVLDGRAVERRIRRGDGISLDMRMRALPEDGFVVSIMDVTPEADASEALERRVRARTAELTEANRLLQLRAAEQAQTEDALRLAKEAAEEAHRSKTRFLAAASHDLLQPINAAKLYISTLQETVIQPTARETVNRLNRSFESMEQLLHALLDISRLDSAGAEFNITTFGMAPLLTSLVADMAPVALEKGVELRVVPSTRWVTSDRRYLLRCVQNLVANAIQYTDRGRVVVGCRARGALLRIEVWDTGRGISEEDQEKIFHEFTRLGDSGGGSGMGLGLSIVERACRHLGHRVSLTSQPGQGSVFSIDVPLSSPTDAMRGNSEPGEPAPEGDLDMIVMMVENDSEVLHATTQKLESWGASVLGARSTETALALMQEIGTPPDIVLADYHLDGEDTGIRAICALRERAGIEIPAIMITANHSKSLLRLGEEMSLSVLTKPVQLSRLRALIDWKTRSLRQ